MTYKILRLPRVMEECGLARSTIYLRVKQGLLPPPVSLGLRSVGWPQTEIEAINAARIAGQTDDQIRALVAELQASRKLGV
jgi:prophage regulatory protein